MYFVLFLKCVQLVFDEIHSTDVNQEVHTVDLFDELMKMTDLEKARLVKGFDAGRSARDHRNGFCHVPMPSPD